MLELLPIDMPRCGMLASHIVIAGPCSAESRESLVECSRAMHRLDLLSCVRAGVWKPRTRPGSFEGIGEPALSWLAEVQDEVGLPAGTEVATPAHVRLAAGAGLQYVWVGARTASNPFAMQQLAEAIGDICPDMPVLVKNPLSPDIELWIGALQRLNRCGVKHLGAIHRGFSVCDSAPYRNAPLWQIPLQLHRRYPDLLLLHDPSHTGGSRDLIAPLAQAAIDLGFDGLMIECHERPSRAMSDGGQQLTPIELAGVLKNLRVRSCNASDAAIERLRLQIDEIDNEILQLLSRRMKLTDEIGDCKLRAGMAALQPDRYSRLLDAMLKRGADAGISEGFIRTIFESIHEESIRRQLKIMNGE